MANKSSTQTEWLEDLRKNKTPVTIIITNGFQMQGTIKDFDDFIILMKNNNGGEQMVYKHAISTITPSRHISILDSADRDGAEE